MIAYEVGKQGLETCKNLFEKVFSRLRLPFPDTKIQIFSDGNDDYKTTISEYYAETCVDFIPIPRSLLRLGIRHGEKCNNRRIAMRYPTACCGELHYGQIIKIRECGKVVDKRKKIIFGSPSIDEIETTDIENMNSICRERMGRLVRKTKCYSKKKPKLVNAIELFQFYWNFMDRLPRSGTPAMIEKLTNHQWSWDEFFNFQLSILN